MGTDTELRLDVVAGPRAAAVVRCELRAWLRRLDWPVDGAADIALAVTEAVSNSVIHAYPRGRPGPVRVEATVAADGTGQRRVELVVADEGRWRTASCPAPSPVAQVAQGLAAIRAAMAVALVRSDAHGTSALMHSAPVPSRAEPQRA